MKEETEQKGEYAIALVLRYGAMISTVIMAVGVVLSLFRKTVAPPVSYHSIRPELLFGRIGHLDPLAIMELGILLLLFTPLARIVVAVITFALERDMKYVLISLGVLAVVLLSISFAVEG
jgi:uncharacterized membrane protein